DAIQAAHWCQWIEPLDEADWPHRELRLGFDTRARLLETVVLVFQSGDEAPPAAAQPARGGSDPRSRRVSLLYIVQPVIVAEDVRDAVDVNPGAVTSAVQRDAPRQRPRRRSSTSPALSHGRLGTTM